MALLQRIVSFALLLVGVALVFLGLTQAQGFTLASGLTSVAAIAALLYTGAVWFAPARPRSQPGDAPAPLLFDVQSRVVTGLAAGRPLTSQFPHTLHADLERQCALAFAGSPTRFRCTRDGATVAYDIVPVRGADGAIVYGILLPLHSTEPSVAAAL